MRWFPVGVCVLLGLSLLVGPGAAAEPHLTITLRPGEEPDVDASLVNWRVSGERAAEWIEFNLTTPRERLIVRVASEGFFDVNRARQVMPEVGDGRLFFETSLANVRDPESGGRLVNVTKSGDTVTLDLSFFVTGSTTLRLTRDVTKPTFQVGEPYDLKHYSFLLKTETDEYALATLTHWKVPDGEAIPLPTTVYALEQTFPVQGLDGDSEYRYRIRFEDWAKNGAESPEYQVRTPPLVTGAPPVVLHREPAGNFSKGTILRAVEANYTTQVGTIDPAQHVRLFVDLTEVTHSADITATRVRYEPPEPFAAGFHRVGLEVSNSEGGKAVETWSFCVAHCNVVVDGAADEGAPGAGVALFLVALGVAAVLRGRRAGER